MFLANIFAEDSSETSVGSRMRLRLTEKAIGRYLAVIGADAYPGLLHGQADIVFLHAEIGCADAIFALDQEIANGIERLLVLHASHLRDGASFILFQFGNNGGDEHH